MDLEGSGGGQNDVLPWNLFGWTTESHRNHTRTQIQAEYLRNASRPEGNGRKHENEGKITKNLSIREDRKG
jgi:hypothetical protein